MRQAGKKEDIKMGRYFHLGSGKFDGKFGFTVQDSTDPEIFGMEEQEPCYIDYYLEDSKEAEEHIIKVLNEQYDILGYPEEKRIYQVERQSEIDEKLDDIQDYVFIAKKREAGKSEIGYALSEEDEEKLRPEGVSKEEFDKNWLIVARPGADLAECRIYLGIKILSELKSMGYCSLEAEL